MNIWRMKLRAGTGGVDMYPICLKRGVVSYTHPPIYEMNFTDKTKTDIPSAVKGSALPSVKYFAWDISGGDEIYIGDSSTKSIIAKCIVKGEVGKRAYRFNAGDAIPDPNDRNIFWRHEIPVDWVANFMPFKYKDPAPQNSVICLTNRSKFSQYYDLNRSLNENNVETPNALLNELSYQRETRASQKNILRLHVNLSNRFRLWIERKYKTKVKQEDRGIDLIFTHLTMKHIAELKICYGEDTRHAIREALGQLFEYNHYPSYEEADFWWLVLDFEPSENDLDYISVLRERYSIPLTIAWSNGNEFKVYPSVPLSLK